MERLRDLGERVRAAVRRGIASGDTENLSRTVAHRGGDVIFALDLHADRVIQEFCAAWGEEFPLLLVCEGIEGGRQMFPAGTSARAATFTLIADPIDGTRGLMYGKRSAWALFGVAPPPRDGAVPTLAGIRVALQTELPTPRALLADAVWAVRGEGVQGETVNLMSGERTAFVPRPSGAETLEGGFGTIVKFFPGSKSAAAGLEERVFHELLGPPRGTAQVFDDEYISTGGQLYELMIGHDRFIADLRPVLAGRREAPAQLCCHPYDICTWIVAAEAGVEVTDDNGRTLSAPLDTETPVAWIGYANGRLRHVIEPVLLRLLRDRSVLTL